MLEDNIKETRLAMRSQGIVLRSNTERSLYNLAMLTKQAQLDQTKGLRKHYPVGVSVNFENALRLVATTALQIHKAQQKNKTAKKQAYKAYWAIPTGTRFTQDEDYIGEITHGRTQSGRRASKSHRLSPDDMMSDPHEYFEGRIRGVHGIWRRTGDHVSDSGYPRPYVNLMYRLKPRTSEASGGITASGIRLRKLKPLRQLGQEVAERHALEESYLALESSIKGS